MFLSPWDVLLTIPLLPVHFPELKLVSLFNVLLIRVTTNQNLTFDSPTEERNSVCLYVTTLLLMARISITAIDRYERHEFSVTYNNTVPADTHVTES